MATAHRTGWSLRALKTTLLVLVICVGFVVAASYDREPDLSHVHVAILSGSQEGNYHAVIAKTATQAQRLHGRVANISSAGSVENIKRLDAAKRSCEVQFALVQEGLPWPESNTLELIGRLPVAEVFVVLGRDADALRSVPDLRGKRIGIGPPASGTESVARQVMAQLAGLELHASTQSLQQQLTMLEDGTLDLAAMVIDPDAQLLVTAVRERKLQLLDLPVAEALAHYLPSARAGVIKAGYYDPVAPFPPSDKRVIDVDTLLIGNGCARESATQGLITAMLRVFPEFMRVNREQPNLTGLEYASAARSYFDAQRPDPVGEYAPWVIDIMPTARWLQLIFAFSVLFGAQALFHRFRLWQLDTHRIRIEEEVSRLFAPGTPVTNIGALQPTAAQRAPQTRAVVDALISELEALAERCRRHSVSIVVPMGQEMNYRYQEALIAQLLGALRDFRQRLEP